MWVALIYSTLSLVRPLCEFLRKTMPLDLLVNATILLWIIFFACKILFHKKFPSRLTIVLFLGIGVLYAIAIKMLPIAEERIHLVEYGVLSFLIYRALRLDFSRVKSYAGALILAFVLGWIDEGIQEILPTRYYDNRDVILNGVSALLGLMLVAVVERRKYSH